MDESRGRFGEAVELVMNALETGVAEHSGTYYQQERRQLRPAPLASFRGRTYAAAVSPESLEIIARLGVGLLVIPQKPWDVVIADVQTYRRVFREVNDTEPPPPILAGWVMCDEDEQRARVLAHRYIGAYYASVLRHYELAGRHFAETDGYEYYARMSRRLAVDGPDAATAFFVDLHPYGTPEQCLAKIEAMSASIGADTFVGVFGYGGMSDDEATQNLSLFHDRVMPGLRALRPEQAAVG
jgi:alkanesulfonate monooxygenase SsuD/methylene tetrahydromethanopterin reductase-like flavin-dependent oxidoreductase (luciferase family)